MLNFRHLKFLVKAVIQLYKQLVAHQKHGEQVVFVIMELLDEKEAQDMANHLIAQEIGAALQKIEDVLPSSDTPKKRTNTLN
jgi:hypothetical protein